MVPEFYPTMSPMPFSTLPLTNLSLVMTLSSSSRRSARSQNTTASWRGTKTHSSRATSVAVMNRQLWTLTSWTLVNRWSSCQRGLTMNGVIRGDCAICCVILRNIRRGSSELTGLVASYNLAVYLYCELCVIFRLHLYNIRIHYSVGKL